MSNLISVMRPEMYLWGATDKITARSSKSEFLDLIILKLVIYFSRECRPISLVDGFCQAFSGHIRGIQGHIPSACVSQAV